MMDVREASATVQYATNTPCSVGCRCTKSASSTTCWTHGITEGVARKGYLNWMTCTSKLLNSMTSAAACAVMSASFVYVCMCCWYSAWNTCANSRTTVPKECLIGLVREFVVVALRNMARKCASMVAAGEAPIIARVVKSSSTSCANACFSTGGRSTNSSANTLWGREMEEVDDIVRGRRDDGRADAASTTRATSAERTSKVD
ncbi:hypothetical protein H257_04566 [Aphanomyces astaci]|uniref:Uncharacterized protein n=1 Tax=Aphanomyces astaci TaxID=112090 RepID=W4GUS0_APHAT|nr:hypothetical protein H257_04566 [Aphanomyces astaci]ETV82769.1 hypothetical protein H257_04566 [Aphanomyces astaci]|eukprot:XP_009827440.1 hypothetical protein H257_04566 [Aphanomyces astaci]